MLSFPFPFRTFRKIAETFPSCRLLLSWERKGPFTFRKIAETFPSCKTFPGKGKDLSQLTPFLGKDLSIHSCVRAFVTNIFLLKSLWNHPLTDGVDPRVDPGQLGARSPSGGASKGPTFQYEESRFTPVYLFSLRISLLRRIYFSSTRCSLKFSGFLNTRVPQPSEKIQYSFLKNFQKKGKN